MIKHFGSNHNQTVLIIFGISINTLLNILNIFHKTPWFFNEMLLVCVLIDRKTQQWKRRRRRADRKMPVSHTLLTCWRNKPKETFFIIKHTYMVFWGFFWTRLLYTLFNHVINAFYDRTMLQHPLEEKKKGKKKTRKHYPISKTCKYTEMWK